MRCVSGRRKALGIFVMMVLLTACGGNTPGTDSEGRCFFNYPGIRENKI